MNRDQLTFNALIRAGYNFAVTLPCGMLKELIRQVENSPDILHVPLAREEEGVGITADNKNGSLFSELNGLCDSTKSLENLLVFRI